MTSLPTQVQRPPLRTGGPNPPVPVQPNTTPTPPTGGTPAPVPTTSPIGIMDWRSRLAQGDENAANRTVQGNELVQTHMNNLMRSDNAYLQIARDRAMNAASGAGMMMSTMAGNAAQRGAIEAALPIASQDATTYGRTASENMAATNADRLADQGMWGQLLGQEVGIRANLDESERARGFTHNESLLGRQHQTNERLGTQTWQQGMQTMQNTWQAGQNTADRTQQLTIQARDQAQQKAMQTLQNTWQGNQNALQLAQQRFQMFEQSLQNQNQLLAQTIAQIYANPNLSSTQQAAAVQNARAMYQSLFDSWAKAMSGGVPQIFVNPYPRPGTSTPTLNTGVPPTTGGPQPPTTVRPPIRDPYSLR